MVRKASSRTFIGPEMQRHEDVDLFIFLPDMSKGHVISPVSINYNPNKKGCPRCSDSAAMPDRVSTAPITATMKPMTR